jgi:hypothetical protein
MKPNLRCYLWGTVGLGSLTSLAVAAWVVSAGATNRRRPQQPHLPPLRTITLRVPGPVSAVSWSPTERRLLYIRDGELRDWPQGRRLRLPKAYQSSQWKDRPLAWAITLKPGGRELAVMRAETTLIDAVHLQIKPLPPNALNVGWRKGTLCFVPAVEGEQFSQSDRQEWYWGSRRLYAPKGLMITAISAGGEAMLARVAGEEVPGYSFSNIAVLKLRDDGTEVQWKANIYPRPTPVGENSVTDMVIWNSDLQTAAVVAGEDSADGFGASGLYVVSRRKVSNGWGVLPVRDKGTVAVHAASQPSWVGNRLLAHLACVMNTGTHAKIVHKLVLFDPRSETTWILKEHRGYGLMSAGVSHDQRELAYCIQEGKSSKVVIAPLQALVARSRVLGRRGRQ